jgi:hypothetical protein
MNLKVHHNDEGPASCCTAQTLKKISQLVWRMDCSGDSTCSPGPKDRAYTLPPMVFIVNFPPDRTTRRAIVSIFLSFQLIPKERSIDVDVED